MTSRQKSINENATQNDTNARSTFRNRQKNRNGKRAVSCKNNLTIQESFDRLETKGIFFCFKLPTGMQVFCAIATTLFDRLRQFSRRKHETILGDELGRRCRSVCPHTPRSDKRRNLIRTLWIRTGHDKIQHSLTTE